METTTINHIPIRSKAYSIDYIEKCIIKEWIIIGVFTPLFQNDDLVYHLVRKEGNTYVTAQMLSWNVFETYEDAENYLTNRQ
jgi:hypothetical protein